MTAARIEDDSHERMANMWEAGWSQGQIAVKFGTSQQNVWRILHKWYGSGYDDAAIIHEANRDGTAGVSERIRVPTTEDVAWDMFRQGWACSEIDGMLKLERGTCHGVVVGKWADDKARFERMRGRVESE